MYVITDTELNSKTNSVLAEIYTNAYILYCAYILYVFCGVWCNICHLLLHQHRCKNVYDIVVLVRVKLVETLYLYITC